MDWLVTMANWIGSALCHQWDSHSYIINGMPLCLCARCTGTYLGVLLTLGYLQLRSPRGVGMPRVPYLAAFATFFVVWAGDGVNSYLTTLAGAPFLYAPQNVIRLTTGTLVGIALGSLLFVMLRSVAYQITPETLLEPLFNRARDFWMLLALGASLVILINTQWTWLFYPVTALLLVSMILVPTVLTDFFLATALESTPRPGNLRRYAVLALGLSLVLLFMLAAGRAMLGIQFEPPI